MKFSSMNSKINEIENSDMTEFNHISKILTFENFTQPPNMTSKNVSKETGLK